MSSPSKSNKSPKPAPSEAAEAAEAAMPSASDDHVARTRVLTGFRASALPIMLLLPPLVYYMWICVTYYGGAMQFPLTMDGWVEFGSHVEGPSTPAFLLFAGWYLLQIVLQHFAPGKWIKGVPLQDGRRLEYKMNGWFSWWFTLALGAVLVWTDVLPATLFADNFGGLLTIVNLFAFGFSFYLYFYGRMKPKGEASSGNPIYDYFMGTALNPRIGTFDLKLFFEARPGLILWVLINFSFAAQQLEKHGTITIPMILVCFFHFFYIADYFYNEPKILSTMDIKHENFGWMLCWGDSVLVPFTYTLQAMYLVDHVHDLPWWATVGIVVLNFAGYMIFRGVNSQKDRFRRDPERPIWGKKPTYIKTKRGTLLLTSGWWGMSRHANYMGDLTMALAWCLPCLFGNVLPYYYFIYFSWLLIHRQWRDDKLCAAKYGDDWDAYCKKVPYRIVPGIF